jgi:hypothetical protein
MLAALAETHFERLVHDGLLARRRQEQAEAWLKAEIAAEAGRRGVELLGAGLRLADGESPFTAEVKFKSRLNISLA